jgi:hypothetical protein
MSYATSSDQSQMMSQSPSPANAGAVPDLVKIGQIPTNTAIDIETDILDPVVHSDTFCRFQLQNKGILHSNSKIILRLATNSVAGFLPVGVGIHSLIERCALRVGTKTMCEIDDYNHYAGYKSMFLANEHQKQREMFMSGRRLAHKPYYSDYEGANNYFGSEQDLTTKAERVGLDNGAAVKSTDAQATSLEVREWLRTSSSYGPELTISLQELFPFLSQNQLPLFMMNEPVTIELFFSKAAQERLCLPESASGSTATEFTIDTTATQLVADYQYFPQEMMEQYAQQNANLSFTYSDYRLAKRSIDINASGSEKSSGQLIINVGGAGRLVTKVFTALEDTNIKSLSMLNKYHSRGLERLYTGTETTRFNGSLTSNVKYNDHFLYPVDVTNSAQQFHYLVGAEGMVPFVNREEYNFEGQGLASGTYEGWQQKSEDNGLANNFFYQAYKLNRNERINSRGIELYNTWDKIKNSKATGTNTATLRTYLEIVRVAQLVDGKMETFFA